VNTPPKKKQSPFISLFVDVIIPVVILNKLTVTLGPVKALLLALAFPIAGGIYSFIQEKKLSWLSVLGLINVLSTGGMALIHVEGHWFAVKEAIVPAGIGLVVVFSAFTKRPLLHTFLLNDQVFNLPMIEERLQEMKTKSYFEKKCKDLTFALAGSFFLSAVLNFVIALSVFTPLAATLSEAEQAVVLNEQISTMTWMGYVFIALPSLVVTGLIIWQITKVIKTATGLEFKDVMVQH
jgi:intracellular septation protein A